MKPQIEIKMSKNPKDLRIRHFQSMSLAPENGFSHAQEGMFFLASFLGLRYQQLLDFKAADIKRMTGIALAALSKLDLTSALPKEIVIAGTSYYLVEPNKVGIGWHIDFRNCSIIKDPVRMACMFYLQKGYNYSDADENGNIRFPIDSRYKPFEEHFPLDLFIRASGFFLKRSLHSILRTTLIETTQKRVQISLVARLINPFSGRQPLKPSWVRSIFRGTKRSNSTTEPSTTDASMSDTRRNKN